jgi:hypothetical protein
MCEPSVCAGLFLFRSLCFSAVPEGMERGVAEVRQRFGYAAARQALREHSPPRAK